MTHLILGDELHRVELGDGEWVDIKRHLSLSDLERIEADAGDITAGRIANGRAMLTSAIKAWSFTNGTGEPVAVTPENVGCLSGETAGTLLVELNRLNPVRTEAEQKKSSPVSTRPSRRARRSQRG